MYRLPPDLGEKNLLIRFSKFKFTLGWTGIGVSGLILLTFPGIVTDIFEEYLVY